ncbi:PPK2 family polyphosphate kinase [Janthinobacterium agaricidamnosum]|uniref:Polyphosphate kinase 2 family protein n=1 Tax=Janthinobacterium agaricidamnosum NBRC 102515 = DSM 9628 TaxID=1349767 RepID=W0VAK1_9BURK|nr:PPK2 family polyphosphate kinase [Janthinobacterium agaricidamnosum]CDG85844.1 polyphosphate kinase 2 family protein [Janthinobacterium agaricidamnosum NBRC 102515 = DSM 9628]
MKVRDRFRAARQLRLSDEQAGAILLGAATKAANKKLTKAQCKALDREEIAALTAQIAACQDMLYAQRRQKVLLVLQGMDTSGKDGTVKAMFSHINPMGIRAVAFKGPTDIELAHDYLWRVHQHVPVKGEIAIFNRSHYEDVLITRVQNLIDRKECQRRYGHIRDFERMLSETGTIIVKVFLHISKDEQRGRLQERLDDPNRQWKFDPNDIAQRKLWDGYQRAYEAAIAETDADHAPWYVVPSNSKTQRNLVVASLLLETLQALKLDYPPPDPKLSSFKVS